MSNVPLKKRSSFLLLALLLGLMPLLALPVNAQDEATYSLTVMHTNDVHSTYDPDGDDRGGVARQATVVKQVRAEVENSLLVDCGDRFTGSIFHSFYQGWDSAQVMNAMGYDAMVLGSYEFTHGAERLSDFLDLLDFPVVVANVDFSASDLLVGKTMPYTILEMGGEQIGIIGVTQGDSRIRPIADITFDTDVTPIIQRYADELTEQGVNKIILLSHLGYFADLDLATRLTGIDVIAGGDSNTLLSNTLEDAEGPYPAVMESLSEEPVLVVQSWERVRVMGRLDVEFDADGVIVSWGGDAIPINGEIEDDPEMVELIEQLRAPLGDFQSQVLGSTEVRLVGEREVCRYEECNMGNLITDAMRVATGAQIALQNGGGIRASIEIGDITVGDVLQVLPFNNTFVIFELSGADLITALENSVSHVELGEGDGRFLQVSGLSYTWDGSQEAGRRIVRVEVENDDGDFDVLDPDEIYTVVTNDYLFAGGDDYAIFSNSGESFDFGRSLDEIVRTYITQTSPISIPETEDRIIRQDR